MTDVYDALKTAKICALPVDPAAAARALGIKVVTYDDVADIYEVTARNLYNHSRFGFSFRLDGLPVIAVNERCCGERRRRFTVAHELGHCLLGHSESGLPLWEKERAADRFAAEFLAPLCVLNLCGVSSAAEIAVLCGISDHAARIRFKELQSKREKDPDFFDDNSQVRIIVQFSRFITRYLAERSRHDRYEEYLIKRIKT